MPMKNYQNNYNTRKGFRAYMFHTCVSEYIIEIQNITARFSRHVNIAWDFGKAKLVLPYIANNTVQAIHLLKNIISGV